MRRARLIPALSLLVGGALLLSACGGDDSPEQPIVIPTETTASLAKDEFIEEADAICAEANSAIGAFVSAGEGFTESGQIADLRQSVVDDVNALGPPADDQANLDGFLAGMEAQVAAGEKIALANERGSDTAQFETELDAAQGETLTAAEAYGFTECGQEPSSSGTSTTGTGVVTPDTSVAPAPTEPDTSGGGVGDTGGDTGDGTGGSGGGVGPGGGVSP
jgi:hypothetical protein